MLNNPYVDSALCNTAAGNDQAYPLCPLLPHHDKDVPIPPPAFPLLPLPPPHMSGMAAGSGIDLIVSSFLFMSRDSVSLDQPIESEPPACLSKNAHKC
jgi:hypothetical protein